MFSFSFISSVSGNDIFCDSVSNVKVRMNIMIYSRLYLVGVIKILMPSNYVQMSNIYFFPFHIKMSITQCNKNSITEAFVPDRNHIQQYYLKYLTPDHCKEEKGNNNKKSSPVFLLRGRNPEAMLLLKYFTLIKSTALRLLPQLYVLVRWKGTTVKH